MNAVSKADAKRLGRLLPLVLATCGGGIIGLVLAFTATPVYECEGKVVIRRNRLAAGEETRNRWVWVRDGLSVNEELISDRFLAGVLGKEKQDPTDPALRGALESMRGAIRVQFTGADSHAYWIRVRLADPQEACQVAGKVVSRLRRLHVNQVQNLYDRALVEAQETFDALKGQKAKAKGETPGIDRQMQAIGATIDDITAAAIVHKAESKDRVQQVILPKVPTVPVWPRKGLAVFAGLFGGFCAGLGLSWLTGRNGRPSK